ncbi:unnamed protein product [Pylaiella littoralis]
MQYLSRNAAAITTLLLCHHVAHFATGFTSSSPTTAATPTGNNPPRKAALTTPTMGPAPGLFPRKLPSGLGSWRVESIVDSGKPNSMFVFLFDDGSVHTAVSGADGQDDQAGRWRVRGNEFSLTVDRRSKSRMLEDLRYVGVLKKFSSVVEGSVIEGQMDPAVVGKFKMTPLESSMATDLKKAAEAIDSDKYIVPKYSKSALAGTWVLMWQDTGAVFRLRLGEDLMFESVEGVGSGQLGGRWNLWGPDRMSMTVVRSKSHGVQMHGDHMFWGTKIEGPADSKIPLKISGYVMYGFLEPTCVGRFIMRRSQQGKQAAQEDDG